MKGKFITLEGGEGAGKSTQAQIICEMLRNKKIDYIKTREPGGTTISEKIRGIVLDSKNGNMSLDTEILLFSASRSQLIDEVILPSLNEGKIVICDRYVDSSIVYQGLANENGNMEKVKKANFHAFDSCMPDLTLYFDIDPIDAFKRKNGADENDRIEMKGLEYHKKVRQGFLTLAELYPERIKVIDASKTIDEVTEQIFDNLKSIIGI